MIKRITIFGLPGSGKSTLAIKLGKLLNLPVYHVDKYFFTANWQKQESATFLAWQKNTVAQDCWIIDGNATKSLEPRWARTDIAIYMHYPRLICLYRLLKRTYWDTDRTIDDRASGCTEQLTWKLISYMYTFEQRVAPQLVHFKKAYPNVPLYIVSTDDEVAALVKKLTTH